MKALIMVIGIALTSCQLDAQKMKASDVPQHVKDSLSRQFDVKDVDWEKEVENYEASFKQKGQEISVLISAEGSILEVEREINQKDLPASIHATLARDFNEYDVKEASVIESKGEITYEAEVKKSKETFDLIFDSRGNLVKKVQLDSKKD